MGAEMEDATQYESLLLLFFLTGHHNIKKQKPKKKKTAVNDLDTSDDPVSKRSKIRFRKEGSMSHNVASSM